MRKSNRGDVDPFIVMDVMEAARAAEAAGRHIIHMEVGQPGTGAPPIALDAVRREMRENPLGYTVALGLPELRAQIAALYQTRHGVALDPARVVVTPGSSGAFLLAFTALFDNGARVGIGAPGYPSYRQILKAVGLEPVVIEAEPENGYQLVPSNLDGQGLHGLMMASPANPTGTMLSRADLARMIEHSAEHRITFISDEIYHGIEYETQAVSALEISDDTVVINSFSKYFSMTGWRVGWMVVPPDLVRTIERLAQNMFICAPHIAQVAALAAMQDQDVLQSHLSVYAQNRDVVLKGLQEIGCDHVAPPDGAFYAYVDISRWSSDSLALSQEILAEAGVAVTPGLDFDPGRGHRFLRLSYARAPEDIVEGMGRLKAFFVKRG